jgi:hypothetical protein
LGVGGCVLGLFIGACAHPRLSLPADAGAPLPDFQSVHARVSSNCRGIRTLTAELGLSGRAGNQRLRGRVVAGLTRDGSMRLEGVAPFGPPVFILADPGASAVLLLPRDARVLRGARAEDVLGALTGVTFGAADLLAILDGCVVPAPTATAGRLHANGWASIDLAGARLYLQRRDDAWQLRAARRDGWQIEYVPGAGVVPQSVRLQADDPAAMVDLTATLSQVDTNIDLGQGAFDVVVPDTAVPMTLDELRRDGPLGQR